MQPTKKTLKFLNSIVYNFDYYEQGFTKVIDNGLDWAVNEKLTYGQWIDNYKKYSTIKVENLEFEPCIIEFCKNYKTKNIHAFYSQRSGHSFKWHRDNLNVLLLVLSGTKLVKIKNKQIILSAGQSVLIKKNYLHKVFSKKGTWALSIGLK